MKLIVGLGNPGKKFEKTRHNLGFMVVNSLAKERGISFQTKKRFLSLVAQLPQKDILLVKPQTFMNSSGLAVAKLAKFYRLPPTEIWVIHDDLDLPLGKIKMKTGGGSAGHKGVESIIKELGTKDFVRFRLGIGRPEPGASEEEIENYVLASFKEEEKKEVKKMIKEILEVCK